MFTEMHRPDFILYNQGSDGKVMDLMCMVMTQGKIVAWYRTISTNELFIFLLIIMMVNLMMKNLPKKTSYQICLIMVNKSWLSHYPWLFCNVYDNGSEFKFQFHHVDEYGITHKPT